MQAERMPAAAGWLWLRGGFALFRAQPGFLNLLWFSSLMLLVVLNLVPFIGQALASMLVPLVMVGVWNGCRAIDRREPLMLTVLFSGFRARTHTLLQVGIVYLLVTAAALALGVLLAGDALAPLMTPQAGRGLADLLPLLLVLQFATLVSAPVLVAAALVAWFELPLAKSLFFALAGVLRNLRALLVLYVSVLGVSMGLAAAVVMIASVAPAGAVVVLRLAVFVVELFVITPAAIAAVYLALRDIFHPGPATHVAA